MSAVAIRAEDLAELRAPRRYPAVSILVPRNDTGPATPRIPSSLRVDLADEAVRRAPLVERLRDPRE